MAEPATETVIRAGQPAARYWRELWEHRELLWFLSWRDLLARYKQTAVGVAWALVKPAVTAALFTAIFSLVAKLPSEGAAPYPILVMTGLLPWFLFASALAAASNSLVDGERLITKVYFPRMVLPASSVLACLVDFAVGALLLAALFAAHGLLPDARALAAPLFIGLALAAALGPGLLFAALNVSFRDFRVVVPFLLQIGLYASPAGYASSLIPEPWRLFYSLNPMVAPIDGLRWALLGGEAALWLPGFALSVAANLALLGAGIAYFRRAERAFADVV